MRRGAARQRLETGPTPNNPKWFELFLTRVEGAAMSTWLGEYRVMCMSSAQASKTCCDGGVSVPESVLGYFLDVAGCQIDVV